MRHEGSARAACRGLGLAFRVVVAAGIVVASLPLAAFCALFVGVALLASHEVHAAVVLGVAVGGAMGAGAVLALGFVGAWAVLTVDWRSAPSVLRDALRRRRGPGGSAAAHLTRGGGRA